MGYSEPRAPPRTGRRLRRRAPPRPAQPPGSTTVTAQPTTQEAHAGAAGAVRLARRSGSGEPPPPWRRGKKRRPPQQEGLRNASTAPRGEPAFEPRRGTEIRLARRTASRLPGTAPAVISSPTRAHERSPQLPRVAYAVPRAPESRPTEMLLGPLDECFAASTRRAAQSSPAAFDHTTRAPLRTHRNELEGRRQRDRYHARRPGTPIPPSLEGADRRCRCDARRRRRQATSPGLSEGSSDRPGRKRGAPQRRRASGNFPPCAPPSRDRRSAVESRPDRHLRRTRSPRPRGSGRGEARGAIPARAATPPSRREKRAHPAPAAAQSPDGARQHEFLTEPDRKEVSWGASTSYPPPSASTATSHAESSGLWNCLHGQPWRVPSCVR